jgi:hypothetical protein
LNKTFVDLNIADDERYTKFEDALALAHFICKIIKIDKKITMPFFDDGMAIHRAFSEVGFKNIDASNSDFFERDFTDTDLIISNPPFSDRTKIFTRLFAMEKPFIMLQPLPMAFNNNSLVRLICKHSDAITFLCPDGRMGFVANGRTFESTSNFYSAWLCYKIPAEKGFVRI